MATVHGAPHQPVTEHAFREALREVGATALQLNRDDDAVAAALRFGPGEPVTALVSVWTEGEPAAAVEAIARCIDRGSFAGYRVTERVRLDPEPVPDGQRADVMAQVAVLRRPAGMTRADYLSYWMVKHTPIAIRTQNTSGYIQNIVEDALTPGAPEIAAIVEEHFPMAAITDPHEFYGSRGDEDEMRRRIETLMSSVARFGADKDLDLVPTSRYVWHL